METGKLIFITGGARSGKSSFAEAHSIELAKSHEAALFYIATARGSDEEMEARIKRHKTDRLQSGYQWATLECPTHIQTCVEKIEPGSVVLLDCVTILLSNTLFQSGFASGKWADPAFHVEVQATIIEGITRLREKASAVIVVSNEVLHGAMRAEAPTAIYERLIGYIHQQIVQQSNQAYLVEAGIPIEMKG